MCAGAVGAAGWAGQEVTTVDSNCIPSYALATERGRAHGGTPRTGSARALRPGIGAKGVGGEVVCQKKKHKRRAAFHATRHALSATMAIKKIIAAQGWVGGDVGQGCVPLSPNGPHVAPA